MSQNIKNLSQSKSTDSTTVGAKKDGTVRIGMAGVKTGSIGEGLNAQELAAAIKNTLSEYLKGSKVELVPLEAKLASTAITTAANATTNVKPKDEITLDIKSNKGSTATLTKQYKAKAKSAGEDIISPLIEQAAQAIIDAAAK